MRSPATAVLVAAAAVIGAALASASPPAPRGAEVPATEFSEARAMPVLERLASTRRLAGSVDATRALRDLEAQLRAVPGLEVEVQTVTGFAEGIYSGPSIYTVRNLVARLPGTELAHESVLLAAHYDSAPMSHGAADDALSCAAVVEAARCLAAGPRPWRSVVLLLDEGEELGLFGAKGFLRHPLAKTVVAFVNLEAAGCRGRPILFQTGPGDPWLAGIYARAVPHPHGTALGQDVFQSGVIPSDTDFRVYRDDGGLRGLDVALYRDGWAYHTVLDRVERLEPGSLQEMGDNALAAVRALADADLPSGHIAGSAVYYDVLGLHMVSYGAPVAVLLALAALASLFLAVRAAARERGLRAAEVVLGALWIPGALLAVAVWTALASLPGMLRWHGVGGWYARPWLAVVAFGVPAAALVLVVARLSVLRFVSSPVTAATRLAAGVGLFFAALLVWGTVAGVGSAYLALWWVVGAAAAVRLAARGRFVTAALAGCVVPGVLTVQAADALLATFVPVAGRLGGELEPMIAALAASPVALGALLPAAVLAAAPPRWSRGGIVLALLAGAGGVLGGALVPSPYTAERPQRVGRYVVQVVLPEEAVRTVQNPFRDDREIPRLAAARLRVLRQEPLPGGGRRLHVVLEPHGATGVHLDFEGRDLVRIAADGGAVWAPPAGATSPSLAVVAPPAAGLPMVLDLAADRPVHVDVRSMLLDLPPDLAEALEKVAPNATPDVRAWVRVPHDL